ncbi:MAG: IS200/IS605 family transposase [Patescibacteria group bacterium]|nr:IS200/IS605 family transposase [Patescibacteria group bacterium]
MKRYIKTLSHCFYECKYHIVFTPKYRGRIFQNDYVKSELNRIIRLVCKWKGFEVMELNIQEDHLHLCLIISPKHSISYAMAIIKGKTSAWIKKGHKKIKGLCDKGSLWARGYFVSTIGIDELIIRRYVKYQSQHNQKNLPSLFDQMFKDAPY